MKGSWAHAQAGGNGLTHNRAYPHQHSLRSRQRSRRGSRKPFTGPIIRRMVNNFFMRPWVGSSKARPDASAGKRTGRATHVGLCRRVSRSARPDLHSPADLRHCLPVAATGMGPVASSCLEALIAVGPAGCSPGLSQRIWSLSVNALRSCRSTSRRRRSSASASSSACR